MVIFGKKALSLRWHIVCRLKCLKYFLYCMKQKTNKILAFEYLVYRLIEWYREAISSTEDIPSHFSRLSVLKLLFLISAIKDENTEGRSDLLEIFNQFCAMQYGPVETDIYTAIVKGYTKIYKFNNRTIEISEQKDSISSIFTSLPNELRSSIDNAIRLLRDKNPQIISYPATKLVNITHKWQSWQNAMWMADISGARQFPMTVESIRKDTPYYG